MPQTVLASRFELTAPTQWTVQLRDGVRYSDGREVTVQDVSTALDMYQQVSGSFPATLFPEWPTVSPLDDRTFVLETQRPLPVLDYLMANILITPAEDNRPEELQEGVGSGPYVVTSSDRGTGTYTLDANDSYWGEAPKVRTVQVRFVPEESSRVVSLRSGEVDVIDTISPDSAEQLAGLPNVTIERVPGTRINQLFYNFRKPAGHPLADPRVREALTYAIDGRALAEDVMSGSVAPATGVVPTTLTGALETVGYSFDPRRARQMLESAGVSDLEIKIIWETGEFANDTSIMEAVLQMLGHVGVRTTLQQFQPGGDISVWRQGRGGDWDVLGNGFPNPTGLALTSLQGMYAGTAEKEATRDTYHGYVVPEVVDLLARASAEVEPTTREDLLAQAQEAIWATWPCLWAFVPNATLARRDRVQDVHLGPINSYDLAAARMEVQA